MTVQKDDLARLAELMVDDLLGQLPAADAEAYQELCRRYPQFDLDSFERAAAAMHLAAIPAADPIPERLRVRLALQAADFFQQNPRYETVTHRSDVRRRAMEFFADNRAGWWAAAASTVIALGLWLVRPADTARAPVAMTQGRGSSSPLTSPAMAPEAATPSIAPPRPASSAAIRTRSDPVDPAAERASLLAARRPVLQRAWRPGNDPTGQYVRGDVVWDAQAQRGFLLFLGLRRNNPSVEQYQLWIFDARRDARFPVDGGVFNISSAGEQVVPIRAALAVGVPLMFAITVERPGGVVVSDRSRIAAIANTG